MWEPMDNALGHGNSTVGSVIQWGEGGGAAYRRAAPRTPPIVSYTEWTIRSQARQGPCSSPANGQEDLGYECSSETRRRWAGGGARRVALPPA